MFRKSAVAAALLLISVAPQIFALGLGEIDMRSALNQPMEAVIELTSSSSTNLDDIRISMATLQEHARAGLSKAAILANFRFVVERNGAGNAVIRISSQELVREPYLEFLLELDWSRGRLLRQYTVLVDPPVTMQATPAVPATPVSRPSTPAPVPRAAVRTPAARTVAAPATVSVAPRASAESYGPIRRSETLWTIAERVRPGTDISTHQMMLALQRANPNAFVNNNINRLKAGVTLQVPNRDAITSMSTREARAEADRQYTQWKAGQGRPVSTAVVPPPAVEETPSPEVSPAETVDSGSRLQLTAPENDAVSGAATPGDPGSEAQPASQEVQQQLALAAEEVAAGRAESEELQSRVTELEEQITTMKRLLELKDDELATLVQSVTEDESSLVGATDETLEAIVDATEEPLTPASKDTADEGLSGQVAGLVNRLMDNPLLAGLGVLVAMLLGGFLWASTRSKADEDILDDEMTMERQLAQAVERDAARPVSDVPVRDVPEVAADSSPDLGDDVDSDPVTEADVYLAYGRIQQAEDVLQAALQAQPDNINARMKLLEVYHAGGNTAAFDQAAEIFHGMVDADDSRWQKVAAMGLTASPHNTLYGGGAPAQEGEVEFEMDLSGLEEVNPQPEVVATGLGDSNTIEFTSGTADEDDEDSGEGLLESDDEVTTKLDLARAYIDMDDKDSARSILGEVIEEGNTEQKEEAESIISQIA